MALPLLQLNLLVEHTEIALILFFFVWIFGWAKSNVGSSKLGALFALLVVFLTFYSHRELVWLVVILYLLATFGKELLEKMH